MSSLTVPYVANNGSLTVHSSQTSKKGYLVQPSSASWGNHHFVIAAENTSANTIDFDLLYVYAAGSANTGTTITFNYVTGVISDAHTNNDPDSFSLSETGTYNTSLTLTATDTNIHIKRGNGNYLGYFQLTGWTIATGPTVTYGPSHGALPIASGFTVYNLNFSKMGDREYRISYQQKNAPPSSYTVRVSHDNQYGIPQSTDFTVTTAATGNTINLESGSLYGTGPNATVPTPANNGTISIRFMNFDAKLGSSGSTVTQGQILNTWTYLYNNLIATFTPSSGVPGTIFNFTLTGSDDSYASSNTATLTHPNGNVTTRTKNTYGQFEMALSNITSIEGDYTVEHPTGVNRGTSTYDNSGPPIVVTTSNGGGYPDRYPLIMTNLFNRNRSLYSIGMTHKDTWDLFL